jgi:Rrf2 family protein
MLPSSPLKIRPEFGSNMLSRKGLYAVRALVALAGAYPEGLTTKAIVAAHKLPRKFLEAILIDLRRAGITASIRGREGGHRLARPPERISLAEVIRTTDGPLALMPCASVTSYKACDDCPDVTGCRIRKAFGQGRDALASVFEGITLADLAGRPGTLEALREAG